MRNEYVFADRIGGCGGSGSANFDRIELPAMPSRFINMRYVVLPRKDKNSAVNAVTIQEWTNGWLRISTSDLNALLLALAEQSEAIQNLDAANAAEQRLSEDCHPRTNGGVTWIGA